MEKLEIELFDFLNDNDLLNDGFIEYMKNKTRVLPFDTPLCWFGTFPILDEKNILIDIRMSVPNLKTKENLLVNIHEYAHAFQIFNELGEKYVEKKEEREKYASSMEQKYLIKKR